MTEKDKEIQELRMKVDELKKGIQELLNRNDELERKLIETNMLLAIQKINEVALEQIREVIDKYEKKEEKL